MKKRYIFGTIVCLIVVFFFVSVLCGMDRKEEELENSMLPRIGQKLWTYNMNKHEWHKYDKRTDNDESKEEITLQLQLPEGSEGFTSYALLTGNAQVPKEAVWIGENSEEFLVGKTLYSYYPKQFEYYEIVFNGVKFISKHLTENEISKIFNKYKIIKVSDLKKGIYNIEYSKKNNKYLILNDIGEDFYNYYIIPNDSKNLKIEDFSNQFVVTGKTDIKIQRLEGCTNAYPCYEIKVK